MNRLQLIERTRSITRDLSGVVFRESDVIDFLNEAVDRCAQLIPELQSMSPLASFDTVPDYLPARYHSLLAAYAASRCFLQDERHHQAATLMNEFEQKMEELLFKIQDGTVKVYAPDGTQVLPITDGSTDSVTNVYFETVYADEDDWGDE